MVADKQRQETPFGSVNAAKNQLNAPSFYPHVLGVGEQFKYSTFHVCQGWEHETSCVGSLGIP